ncbi:MAG: sensor histidine kinase [Bacteroidales bacterium]
MKSFTNSEKLTDVDERHSPSNIRSTFLSHISHGIRTPLNSIMGFSRLLMDRQMIDGKPKEYAQRIIYSSNVLLGFVDSLIDLSQYESSNFVLKLQPVSLSDLLWKVAESFVIIRNEQNLSEVELSIIGNANTQEVIINTDYELLKKSVCRLLSMVTNVFRKGTIELGFKRVHPNQVRIYIQPTENALLAKSEIVLAVEDEFNTVESFNYEVLICSVELMGGRVCADSIMDEYYIELPVNFKPEPKELKSTY